PEKQLQSGSFLCNHHAGCHDAIIETRFLGSDLVAGTFHPDWFCTGYPHQFCLLAHVGETALSRFTQQFVKSELILPEPGDSQLPEKTSCRNYLAQKPPIERSCKQ